MDHLWFRFGLNVTEAGTFSYEQFLVVGTWVGFLVRCGVQRWWWYNADMIVRDVLGLYEVDGVMIGALVEVRLAVRNFCFVR